MSLYVNSSGYFWADHPDQLHRTARALGKTRGQFHKDLIWPHYRVSRGERMTLILHFGVEAMEYQDWLLETCDEALNPLQRERKEYFVNQLVKQ